MGKTLILTEKPSVARDMAKVLNCHKKAEGCIIGDKYILTWALGHLVTLAEPEAYNERFKSWKLSDLPMLPEKMKLVVIKNTSKQFGIVKDLLKSNEVDELIIATDSGREGELVARWIIEKAGFKKPLKRLWISSQTDNAIKEGMSNLKPSKEYDNLYKSAQCRAEADWLVGLNITRALTCKYNAQLSAGRVQTPTLAMVVQREEEIKRFVPKDYWLIDCQVGGFSIKWQDKNRQTQIHDKSKAEKIIEKLKGKSVSVTDVKKEAKKEMPPLAYDLTELQRDANQKFGYSAKKTLSIIQKLYETHKLLTYPRTDSKYITEDIVPTLNERLKCIAKGPYAPLVNGLLKNNLQITKRFVDNNKVSDHHAIIPTEQYLDLGSLDSEERNIYDLAARRFIAVLSPPSEYEITKVTLEAFGEMFTAKGKIEKSSGWRAVYDNRITEEEDSEEDNNQSLPDVKKGDVFKIESCKLLSRQTKPPARYTEATLLSAMENPGRFIEDSKMREIMSGSSGLGTPATRADIIEKLFDSFYMERNKKEIVPTSKGIQLISLVPDDLKHPELTAKWEERLMLISKGKSDSDAFISEMKSYAAKLVSGVSSSANTFRHDNVTREKCPQCGQYLLDVKGKKGKMLICPDRECGYKKGVSQVSNARCPKCKKKMEIKGEGNNKGFYCQCGYKEKLDSYAKRKTDKVDKREVDRFLKNQESNEPINSTLADALKNWKK